jgi:hypothetical protein
MPYLRERRDQYRSIWQSEFSLAYVCAIASAAGVTCHPFRVDVDGVDAQLGARGSKGLVIYPKFDVQLKSWTAPDERDGCLHYPLDVDNYEHLRHPTGRGMLPRLLVVMPPSPADWLHMTHQEGALRHCAYWASLAGSPPTGNTRTITVPVPKANQFSVQAVEAIMERIANGKDP